MPNLPFYADYINQEVSQVQPGTLIAKNTVLAEYYKKYYIQRAMSVFKFTIPAAWNKPYFLYTIFGLGFGAVVNTDKYGVIFQASGLRGYDLYYQPTNAVITNPLLRGTLEPRIGVECELIRLQPAYSGIMDIVNKYANLAAMITETMLVNLQNSKLGYVFFSKDKAGAESWKKVVDDIYAGNPVAFVDKDLLRDDGGEAWKLLFQNVGQNYIVDNLMMDLRKVNYEFDAEIGIPNANTDKRERLTDDEVSANNREAFSKAELWFEMLTDSIARVREMFPGIELSVEWRHNPNPMNGGANNGTVEPVGSV